MSDIAGIHEKLLASAMTDPAPDERNDVATGWSNATSSASRHGPGQMVHKPSKAEIAAAVGRTVPDLIAPGLAILFCGINSGLYSGATGHHFARPGNRFWPTLHAAGLTDRLVRPWEEARLLQYGLGITNLVARATASAAELGRDELRAGRSRLERKVRRFRPRAVAVLGIGAYRLAFDRPGAGVGRQSELLGQAVLWVLPNPSGLNANHQLPDLARAFAELRAITGRRRAG